MAKVILFEEINRQGLCWSELRFESINLDPELNLESMDQIFLQISLLDKSKIYVLSIKSMQSNNIDVILSALSQQRCKFNRFAMHNCAIGSETFLKIGELIECCNLRGLTLNKCTFAPEMLVLPNPNLNLKSSLFILQLRHQNINLTDVNIISNLIANYEPTNLYLVDCKFNDSDGANDPLATMIKAITRANTNLTKVCLAIASFKHDATMAIVDCIENSKLKCLRLNRCIFLGRNVPTIKKSSLQSLYFYKTSFACGIKFICDCIEKSQLHTLNMHRCKITLHAFEAIASSIKKSAFLKDVSFDEPLDEGHVNIICDLLENHTLLHLDLSSCISTEADMMRIMAAVKASSLVSLKLDNNAASFTTPTILSLCDLLENHSLQNLCLSRNALNNETILLMLPSIEKSSLTQFKINNGTFGRNKIKIDSDVKARIHVILQEQKNILKRFTRTKKAI